MRTALILAAVLLSQPLAASENSPPNARERVLKANGIEPTPAGILGYINPYSPRRLQQLVQQLGDDSYARRERATKLLSAMPVPVGPLFEAAQSSDPELRYRARIVLKRIRKTMNPALMMAAFKTMRGKAYSKGAPAVLGMIPQLDNESLVAAAAEALGSIAQPEHFALLRAALRRGKHVPTRLVALQALARLNGEKIVDDLKQLVIKEDNEQIRMAAAAALVNLKRRESLDVLAKLLSSKDVTIRAGAVRYLRRMTGQRFGFLAIDNSPARERAARQWAAWVRQHGATAKLNLNPDAGIAASPRLRFDPELLQKIVGHNSTVYCVAFSPDGKRLASSSGDGMVKVWDVATGREVWGKSGHAGITIRSVAYSPDGKLLATGSFDKTIKLWDAKTGSELKTLHGHTQSVRIIAFSRDGKWLASTGEEGTVIVWNVARAKAVHVLKGHSATVRTVAFSPDGNLLASGSSDETIRIWDRKTGTMKKTLTGHKASVRSVAFSPDGGTLASCGLDNTVRLWDVESGRQRVTLGRHSLSVKSLVYSPDGRFIASGGNDRVVNLWDTDSGRLVKQLTGPTSHVWHVAISKDGKLLAAGGSDRAIFIWTLDSLGPPVKPAHPPTSPSKARPDAPQPATRPKRK
jgi:WD40 repeat protein